jgi:hypothetical protein
VFDFILRVLRDTVNGVGVPESPGRHVDGVTGVANASESGYNGLCNVSSPSGVEAADYLRNGVQHTDDAAQAMERWQARVSL